MGIEAGVGVPPVGGIDSKAKADLREILKSLNLLN
jgi:hypothetical protein